MPEKTLSELEKLQLEEAIEAAELRKTNRLARESRLKAIEETLKRDRASQERMQSLCQHRKGGKGISNMYAGNDANYAVITHHCSHGKTIVICQRCGKLWEPPEPLRRNATAQEREKYQADLAEYRRARNLPTDNEASGSVLFSFTRSEEEMVNP